MKNNTYEKRKNPKGVLTIIIALGIALVFGSVIYAVASANAVTKTDDSKDVKSLTPTPVQVNKVLKTENAVVHKVDTSAKSVTILLTETDKELILVYSGGTHFKDKYGKELTASQIEIGELVSVDYQEEELVLEELRLASDAWAARNITNILHNEERRVIHFNDRNYRFKDSIMVISNGKQISISDIIQIDQLNLKGFGDTVYVIEVTRGHGYLSLFDADSFIGGTIYVGTERMDQIEADLKLTIREGSYPVTIEKGTSVGTKQITIERDKKVIFAASEFSPSVVQTGFASFEISPYGAILKLDGKETYYATPVELAYGEYEAEVSLGGYTTYKGRITIDQSEAVFKVTLPDRNLSESSGETELDEWEKENGDNHEDEEDENTGTSNETGGIDEKNNNDNPDNTSDADSDEWSMDYDHTITITCENANGAEVYIGGEYVGIIEEGSITFVKYIGVYGIELINEDMETRTYSIDVRNDGENVSYSFPGF